MRVLVTGAGGQLGLSLKRKLDNPSFELYFLNKESLDICSITQTNEVIRQIAPEWIVNCAAWTNVDLAEAESGKCFQINSIGIQNLVQAAQTTKSRIIQISTDYVFDGESTEPWRENSKKNPISVYGKSKSIGEDYLFEEYPKGSTVLRTSWLYSKYRKNFAKTMIRLGLENSAELNVVADQVGQPTSCLELADVIQQIMDLDITGEIIHGTNRGSASWFEFAQCIFKYTDLDPERIIPIESFKFPQKALRPKYSVLAQTNYEELGLRYMNYWETSLQKEITEILEAVRNGD